MVFLIKMKTKHLIIPFTESCKLSDLQIIKL